MSQRATVARSAEGAQSLPREYYADPAWLARERQTIFQREWLLAAHVCDLPDTPCCLPVDMAGQPVLLVRQEDQAIQAFHNVCRHRGALLVDDPGQPCERGVITCPYHGWSFSLNGSLKGTPNMPRLTHAERDALGLRPIATRVWQGFVLIRFDDESSGTDPLWDTVAAEIAPWGIESLLRIRRLTYEVHANWKLLFQNYSECYHCPLVHPALNRLTPYQASENRFTDGLVLGGPMQLAEGVESMTSTSRRIADCLPGLSGPTCRTVVYYTCFPTFFLSLHPDYVLVHSLHPIAHDRTRVDCDFYVHPSAASASDFDPAPAIEFWDVTNRQDWHVCERVQRGAASLAFQPGPYADLESVVAAFDRHYLESVIASR